MPQEGDGWLAKGALLAVDRQAGSTKPLKKEADVGHMVGDGRAGDEDVI